MKLFFRRSTKILLKIIIVILVLIGLFNLYYYNSDYYRFDTKFQLGWDALENENGNLALQYWIPIANEGYIPAQNWISNVYAFGYGGVDKNYESALYWGVRRVMNSPNINKYKIMYADSYADQSMNGVDFRPSDVNESIKWLKISSEYGSESATTILDNCVYKKHLNTQHTLTCIKKLFKETH